MSESVREVSRDWELMLVRTESPRGLDWLEVSDWLIMELRVVLLSASCRICLMDFLSELARAIILRRWRKSLEIELSIWRRLMLELQLPRVVKPVSLFENPFLRKYFI